MECKQCQKAFESARKTAIFCSPACRNKAFRREVSVAPTSVAKVSVATDKEVSVADKPLEGKPSWGPSWLTWESFAVRLSLAAKISLEEARRLVTQK